LVRKKSLLDQGTVQFKIIHGIYNMVKENKDDLNRTPH
jgi:hypothetical protein